MADDLAGEQILDAREIQPAFRGRHVRDVGDPGLVRSCGSKGLRQYVFRDRQRMRRIRGRREPADLLTTQSQFLPQSLL